ncbi:MAG: acyl-CoA dehydrogenase family protein [Spirochaetes bacterium]|nr:acyl-CoA dehydrogenase family protein [Spirochaetota bacterium]
MQRSIEFSLENEIFRESVRRFFESEVVPHYEEWEKVRMVSREIWRKCGDMGLLLPWLEEKYGGRAYNVLFIAEKII